MTDDEQRSGVASRPGADLVPAVSQPAGVGEPELDRLAETLVASAAEQQVKT